MELFTLVKAYSSLILFGLRFLKWSLVVSNLVSVILWVKVVLARTVIVLKLPTASLPRNASGSIEENARIEFLWLADAWCKDYAHFLVSALHVFAADCW